MKHPVVSILFSTLAIGGGAALLLTTSGCASKGCYAKPIPKAYAEIAELVPGQTTVCGEDSGQLRVYFKNATTPKDAFVEIVKVANTKGWAKSGESTEGPPVVTLIKGPTKVAVTFVNYKGDIYANLELGAIQ